MGLLDRFKALFSSERLDVSARFQLMREAVSGTMSDFYVAREIKTGSIYGLKLLDTEKTRQFESRFKSLNKPSEGEIASSLRHPRIVETYEFGETTSGQQYILMEFLEGTGLHTLINNQDQALEANRLPLLRQMAEAIAAVHEAGYIHRDICPRNFICAPDCRSLKLIDFGLTLPATKDFLQPGNRTGTPSYMAPEVVRRRTTDHRVDIFALGVTAYRMFAGEFPWATGDVSGKAALAHDTEEPTDIFALRPNLNRQLGQLIMKCIESDPDDRPPSAEAVLRGLRKIEGET